MHKEDNKLWSSGIYLRDTRMVQHYKSMWYINKMKDKSHMVTLIGTEKALDKIQQPLIKTEQWVEME